MKKIVVLPVLAMCAALVFAGEFTVSGEVKTGLYWEKTQDEGKEPEERLLFHSKDDAGVSDDLKSHHGRIRLNMEYFNEKNIGFKLRLDWLNWNNMAKAPEWPYAFGYGNFFNDQLTVSIGKLGASPWGTGGPEMWKELETAVFGGMRIEYKPSYVPGLNAGFVLSSWNGAQDQGWANDKPLTLLEILRETVLGVSYTNEWGHARIAYRFDGEYDRVSGNGASVSDEEAEIAYRVEEHILKNYLPGFQVWALGYLMGVGAKEDKSIINIQNWLFAQYNPDLFTAQIRFGLDVIENRTILHIKPSFHWKFFDNLLNVGASFWFGQDFGEGKMYPNSPYLYMELEPKIQVNFSSNAYVAFVYNFRNEYAYHTDPPKRQTQWMNLRFGIFF